MREANLLVLRRAAILSVGSGLPLGLNIFAASQQSPQLIHWALVLTAIFALFGIVFGIWAAKKVTARPS